MRILWSNLVRQRREFIAKDILKNDPFLTRLWYYHLFWIVSFLKSMAFIKGPSMLWAVERRYCRATDRLFGGNREWEFCERRRQGAERAESRAREIESQMKERRVRHLQHMAALDQVQLKLSRDLVVILQGKEITRDPSTSN